MIDYLKTEQEYTYTLIKALVEHGISYFCISPGSRNVFLTQAILDLEKFSMAFKTMNHFDERGSGFHALGVAKSQNGRPALVCTSGTALANFYPAIIEAKQSRQGLLVLSADRLPEQIDTGENQTIRQNNLYGEFVDWQYTFAPFKDGLSIKSVYSIVRYGTEKMIKNNAIVHFNIPLTRPMLPPYLLNQSLKSKKFKKILPNKNHLLIAKNIRYDESYLTRCFFPQILWSQCWISKSVLVIVGHLDASNREIKILEKICTLLTTFKIPVFCDIASSFRQFENRYFYRLYENYIHQIERDFDLVLHFGGALVGKQLNRFISQINISYYYHFDFSNKRFDPQQKITTGFHVASFNSFYKKLKSLLTKNNRQTKSIAENSFASQTMPSAIEKKRVEFLNLLTSFENECHRKIKEFQTQKFSEIDFVRKFIQFSQKETKKNSSLFIGNSLPIRYFDQIAASLPFQRIFSNRGASGIDGLIATASGIASQVDYLFLILGDLSFLHDLNSLALLHHNSMGVFVLNNQGGSIFKTLKMEKGLQKEISKQTCRHRYHFADMVHGFQLPYWQIKDKVELENLFSVSKLKQIMNQKKSFVVEISVVEDSNIREYSNFLKCLQE